MTTDNDGEVAEELQEWQKEIAKANQAVAEAKQETAALLARLETLEKKPGATPEALKVLEDKLAEQTEALKTARQELADLKTQRPQPETPASSGEGDGQRASPEAPARPAVKPTVADKVKWI